MRMLLIEDEKKLCDLIERALKAERYAVDVAATARQVGRWRTRMTTTSSFSI